MRVLVIDNYDSFVYNLVQYLGQLGVECDVRRNDEITVAEVGRLAPGRRAALARARARPDRAGIMLDADHDVRRRAADLRRLPRPPGDRGGVRRDRDPRPRAAARQDLRGHATTAPACWPACPTRSPPPATTRSPWSSRRCRTSRGDRADRRLRRGDGDAAPDAAARGRAVPPRVGADPGRPPDAGQLAGRLRLPRGARTGPRRWPPRSRPAASPPSPDAATSPVRTASETGRQDRLQSRRRDCRRRRGRTRRAASVGGWVATLADEDGGSSWSVGSVAVVRRRVLARRPCRPRAGSLVSGRRDLDLAVGKPGVQQRCARGLRLGVALAGHVRHRP